MYLIFIYHFLLLNEVAHSFLRYFSFGIYFLCRVKVKVYYDDVMARIYNKQKVEQKIRSIMVYVEEMYHERDTLTTIVQICAKSLSIEHASGNNWSSNMR